LKSFVDAGVTDLGRLDVVVANAGIGSYNLTWEITDEQWNDVLDINLKGVWHTVKATVPLMIEQGTGGSIILTSSTAGRKGLPFTAHYTAAKHGVVGICRTLAVELGEYDIRVNTIHPAGVDTLLGRDIRFQELLAPKMDTLGPIVMNTLPHDYMQPEDIANAVAFLASDESRVHDGFGISCRHGQHLALKQSARQRIRIVATRKMGSEAGLLTALTC
jgi:NAD(P)-dependent dehydrogenase (short-subunit alcohol dehydrogenase family)